MDSVAMGDWMITLNLCHDASVPDGNLDFLFLAKMLAPLTNSHFPFVFFFHHKPPKMQS